MIKCEIEFNTEDFGITDKIIKKMLKALATEDLELITDCKSIKLVIAIAKDFSDEF